MTQVAHRQALAASFGDLLAMAKAGDHASWQSLFEDLYGPIVGYLVGRGASGEAEDLAAEVFLQVARDIHRFDGEESEFRSWVFVIAHRRLIDWRRKQLRRPIMGPLLTEDGQGGDVEDEALDHIAIDNLSEILDKLTDEQREVLSLRVIADLSLEETARVVGKRVGAVKALQRRAILALRRDLEEKGVSR